MSAHPVPLPIWTRRSRALVSLLVMIAVVGAVIAAPTLAADGTTVQVDVTQAEAGGVQPEPSAPQLAARGPSRLAVGTVAVMGAAMAAVAGFAVVSRRRYRDA